MKNSINNIGERIRRERLRANLTQAALAGDRISRNMLSMIERGEANPSAETIEYIANRLGVPAGIFFTASDEDDALFEKAGAISKAKALYKEGRYVECADICKSVPFDDEASMILAECFLSLAEENMKMYMLKSAGEYIKSARATSERCSYLSQDFAGTLDYYEALISFAAGRIDIDTLNYLAKRPSRIPAGSFVFLAAMYYLEAGEIEKSESVIETMPFLAPDQMKYFKAKRLARDFKFSQAIELFEELYSSDTLGFFTKYRVAADIEGCYENRRDFESAYKYSSLKHHILELFSK